MEQGGIAPNEPWTRIEAKLRNHEMKLCDLLWLAWPFETVMVIDAQKLAEANVGSVLDQFRHRVLYAGVHPQMAYSVCDAKADLVDGLKHVAPEWFQPEAIWEQFQLAAGLLEPHSMQLISESPDFTTPVLQKLGPLSPLVGL